MVLGVLVELASLSLEQLSEEDSELVLSTLEEVVASLVGLAMTSALAFAFSGEVWGVGCESRFSRRPK